MLNIIIPMAGAGSRFKKEGYIDPKPLIKIKDNPMIKLVINNLKPKKPHKFIFICQIEHIQKYDLANKLKIWAPGCEIIGIDGITDGAARTVLFATEYINNDEELLIANSDQFINIDINDYLNNFENSGADGSIMTMYSDDPKWSFIKLDNNNNVIEIAEKKVISNQATVGLYSFKKGSYFVNAAEEMIQLKIMTNNEFYVAPVYNLLINNNKKITYFNIGNINEGMYGLGTPEDLNIFLKTF